MQQWLLGIAAMSVPVFVAAQCGGDPAGSNITVENQHWAQRAPKDARDMVNWLSIVNDSGHRYGAAQRRSAFRWVGEAFVWKREGRTFTMNFPQTKRKVTLEVKPYACERGIFDRCLDVTWKGRTVTLYSMEDLRIREGGVPVSPMATRPMPTDCPDCLEGSATNLPDALDALFGDSE